MRKRLRLRKKKKINKIIIVIVLLVGTIILVFNLISKKASPVILSYAVKEAKKISSIVVTKSIDKEFLNNLDISKLFIINRDEAGDIKTIDLDPIIVNGILLNTINKIQYNLKCIETGDIDKMMIDDSLIGYNTDKLKKGIIYEIPIGVVFNNTFLANMGPKIPIKISLMGDIIGEIETDITDYGINNALLTVSIHLLLNEQVILPITSEKVEVDFKIPLAIKMIPGRVPTYYFGSNKTPILTVPTE